MARGNYQTRLDPLPADPRAVHPWDEAYLGPYRNPSEWWREIETPEPENATPPSAVKEPSPAFELKSPPVVKPRKQTAAPSTTATQQTLLDVVPARAGTRPAPLKRVMALAKDPSPVATRELVAFLADEDSSIRWLARSSLGERPDGDVVAAIDAFLANVDRERFERALPEAQRALQLIAKTAEDASVRERARALLTAYGAAGGE